MNKYVKRLTDEWLRHGKIIIAVDFDDTISPWKFHGEVDCEMVMKVLREASIVGSYIVVFTACRQDKHAGILEYCVNHNIRIDSINKSPIDLPYGNDNKIYANIFIDDRAGLDQALEILQQSINIIKQKI